MSSIVTDAELKTFAAMQFRVATPLPEVAKIAGLRVSQVRYALERLKAKGVLYGASLFLDPVKLGFTCVSLSFSLHAEQQTRVKSILSALISSERVIFLGAVSGNYQYIATVCVRDVQELWSFLSSLGEPLGRAMHSKAFGVHHRFIAFGRRFLTTRKMEYPTLTYGAESTSHYVVSELEHTLLSLLGQDATLSVRDLAKASGAPPSTVQRHLQSMSRAEVLKGFLYRADFSQLGAVQFKLLLYTRGVSERLMKRLETFCVREKNVLRLIVCLGSWDYEIDIEVFDAALVLDFQERLFAEFGAELNSISSLQILRHIKFSPFPLGRLKKS
jgi:DNA-binding Lrp family transcriptional regulator